MMSLMALHLIGLFVALWSSSSLATTLPFHIADEGSADTEEPSYLVPTSSLLATTSPATEYQTTFPTPTHMNTILLYQVADFLQSNLLIILVGITFLVVILLIICGAVFMSRRQKVNAYYPSAFPPKMYVDQRDKTGGTKPFNEVPEKPSIGQESGPMDSRKQLQADIMRVAKNLRTPNKTPVDEREPKDSSQKAADHSPEDSERDDSLQDNHTPEKQVQCQLSDSREVAGATISPEMPLIPQEQACLEKDVSDESASVASQVHQDQRPTSIHKDSPPVLQLITGEKTAF